MILLINGDAQFIPLAESSINAAYFSPPYNNLRDYGVDGQLGREQLHDCLAWTRLEKVLVQDSRHWWKKHYEWQIERPCGKCYVCNLRTVMQEVWKVLHPTGTVWINLGDSWVRDPKKGVKFEAGAGTYINNRQAIEGNIGAPIPPGLKPKDLYAIPSRVGLALQADGWYWRHHSRWIKKNAMPSSANDRPAVYHEDILMFSKSEIYFYDRYSVLRPATRATLERANRAVFDGHKNINGAPGQVPHTLATPRPNLNKHTFGRRRKDQPVNPDQQYPQHRPDRKDAYGLSVRNWRSSDDFLDSLQALAEEQRQYLLHLDRVLAEGGMLVDQDGEPLAFQINPHGYEGSHYAVWPNTLVREMLLASTSRHGACPKCGCQWQRVVEKGEPEARPDNPNPVIPYSANSGMKHGSGGSTLHKTVKVMTLGWQPTCDCGIEEVVPPTVGDFFVGSGTTLIEARALDLDAVGMDINFDNLATDCRQRLDLDKIEAYEQGRGVVQRPARAPKRVPGQLSLFRSKEKS